MQQTNVIPVEPTRVFVNADEYVGEGIVTGKTQVPSGAWMVLVKIPNLTDPQAFYDYEVNEN